MKDFSHCINKKNSPNVSEDFCEAHFDYEILSASYQKFFLNKADIFIISI